MNPLLLLVAHNLARWAVLATAGWALAHAWRGFLTRAPWGRGARMPGLAFTTLLNIQLVIGLLLYFNSPLVRPFFSTPAYAGSSTDATFFTLLHPIAMTVAALLAQVVYSVAKRAPTNRQRYRVAAIGYTVAVVIVLAAVPWPFLPYGRPLLPNG